MSSHTKQTLEYLEGFYAFHMEVSYKTCPYDPVSDKPKNDAWFNGFQHAGKQFGRDIANAKEEGRN